LHVAISNLLCRFCEYVLGNGNAFLPERDYVTFGPLLSQCIIIYLLQKCYEDKVKTKVKTKVSQNVFYILLDPTPFAGHIL